MTTRTLNYFSSIILLAVISCMFSGNAIAQWNVRLADTLRMTMTPAGNLGIGTNNPLTGLQINRSSQPPMIRLVHDYNNTISSGGPTGWSTHGYNGLTPTTMLNAPSAWDIRNVRGFLIFSFSANPEAQWQDGGMQMVLTNEGNMGLGNIIPTARMDISGRIRVRQLPFIPTTNKIVVTDSHGFLGVRNKSDLGDNLGDHVANQDIKLNGHRLIYSSAVADKGLFIAQNGSIGLGTITPQRQFQLTGTDAPAIRLLHTAGNSYWDMENKSGSLKFWSFSDSLSDTEPHLRVTVTPLGLMGINTDEPATELHVNGAITTSYLNPAGGDNTVNVIEFGTDDASYGGIAYNINNSYYGNGNDLCLYTNNNRDLNFKSGSGDMMFSAANGGDAFFFPGSNGKVGIGTNSPGSRLHIKDGYITLDGTTTSWGGYQMAFKTQSNSVWRSTTPNSDNKILAISMASKGWSWFAADVYGNNKHEVMKLSCNPDSACYINGNCSLGGALVMAGDLSVGENIMIYANGNMWAKELRLKLENPWGDFVFADGYELLPLSQLEAFIAKNKHLPGVPSAEVVQKDGIKLGEMNNVLMQKIEELTLYSIEQQKLIDAQMLRLETMEKEIQSIKQLLQK